MVACVDGVAAPQRYRHFRIKTVEGIDDPASIAAAPAGEHFLVLNVAYNNGTSKNIHVDLTDQVRALPTGGVITLELDVDDFPPESGGQGSGFSAIMKDWDEHVGEFVITQ